MKVRTATYPRLALLAAAWLGVSAGPAVAQSAGAAPGSAPSSQRSASPSKTAGAKATAKKPARKTGRKTVSTSRRSSRKKGQQAPTADRITEIQQALAKDGSYSGAPNGKWDDSTIEAVKKFQDAHGLNPSGKIDAKTLQQLGLGSSTAGAAAPMPPVSSSSTVSSSKPLASKQ